MTQLNIHDDSAFFKYWAFGGDKARMYFVKNTKFFKNNIFLYKKKYWNYTYDTNYRGTISPIMKKTDILFKKPITSLMIEQSEINPIKQIQSLPKNIKILWFKSSAKIDKDVEWTINSKVIPDTLITLAVLYKIKIKGSLVHLKKLEVFSAKNTNMLKLPKFSKSLKVLEVQDNPSLFSKGFNFKLSDYPNLEYVDFRGSIEPERVPKEWKLANKQKNLKILW